MKAIVKLAEPKNLAECRTKPELGPIQRATFIHKMAWRMEW